MSKSINDNFASDNLTSPKSNKVIQFPSEATIKTDNIKTDKVDGTVTSTNTDQSYKIPIFIPTRATIGGIDLYAEIPPLSDILSEKSDKPFSIPTPSVSHHSLLFYNLEDVITKTQGYAMATEYMDSMVNFVTSKLAEMGMKITEEEKDKIVKRELASNRELLEDRYSKVTFFAKLSQKDYQFLTNKCGLILSSYPEPTSNSASTLEKQATYFTLSVYIEEFINKVYGILFEKGILIKDSTGKILISSDVQNIINDRLALKYASGEYSFEASKSTKVFFLASEFITLIKQEISEFYGELLNLLTPTNGGTGASPNNKKLSKNLLTLNEQEIVKEIKKRGGKKTKSSDLAYDEAHDADNFWNNIEDMDTSKLDIYELDVAEDLNIIFDIMLLTFFSAKFRVDNDREEGLIGN